MTAGEQCVTRRPLKIAKPWALPADEVGAEAETAGNDKHTLNTEKL